MPVPAPLDPVLLREHAYYDTKLLRIVLEQDNQDFSPLHIRGLGTFNYFFPENFPRAFSFRGIDINNADPNVDKLAVSEDSSRFYLGVAIVSFGLMALMALLLRRTRTRPGRNLRSLRLCEPATASITTGNAVGSVVDIEKRIGTPVMEYGYDSEVETPTHYRSRSLDMLKTPSDSVGFHFERINDIGVKGLGIQHVAVGTENNGFA